MMQIEPESLKHSMRGGTEREGEGVWGARCVGVDRRFWRELWEAEAR